MNEHLLAAAAGYAFAVFVGHWAIGALMASLRHGVTSHLGESGQAIFGKHPEHPAAIGLLERALYTAAWQLGAQEFIAVWLLLKAAGSWKGWTEDIRHGTGSIPGRTTFSLFLLGSGTSLAFGVTGALLIQHLNRNDWPLALTLAAVLTGATFALKWFIDHSRPAGAL